MTDYSELVKALRLCQFGECGCGKCYYKELKGDWCTEDSHPEFFDCDDKLKLDAADAIEALEKQIDSIENDKTNLEADIINLEIALDKANTQLPKRGEWVEDEYGFIHCSECRMEWDEPEHTQTNYCPNCGAKMTEVQE